MDELKENLRSTEGTLNAVLTQTTPPDFSGNRTKVWLLGEMGGGLVYSSKDNAIGLSRELKEQLQMNEAPDIIFLGGEILPKMPAFKTRGGMDAALMVAKNIEAQDDAVVAVKPYLARMMDSIIEQEKKVQVIYAMGPSDRYNIKSAHDLIFKAYDFNPRFIVETMESLNAKIESNITIAEECEKLRVQAEKELLKLRMKSEEKLGKLKAERDVLLEKIKDHELDPKMAELMVEKEKLLEKLKEHAPKPGEIERMKGRGTELTWKEKNPTSYIYKPSEALIRMGLETELDALEKKIVDLRAEQYRFVGKNGGKVPYSVGMTIRRLDKRITKKQQKTEGKTNERNRYMNRLVEKARQNREEADDYRRIFALYDALEDLWIKEHPDKKVEEILKLFGNGEPEDSLLNRIVKYRGERGAKEILAALKTQYEEINEELANTSRDKEKKKFEELSRKSKSLANLQKKETYTNLQDVRSEAEMKEHERLRGGEIFTHNLTGSNECNDKATTIATEEVLVHLRNAFGRRVPVEIVQDNIRDFEMWHGAKIRVSNNPTNTSQTYNRNTIKKLEEEAQKGDPSGLKLVVMSHTPTGILTVVPKQDNSEEQVRLVGAPPLIDVKKLYESWNASRKTPMTETVAKGPVSSGFWEVVFDGKDVNEVFRTSQYLKNKADEEREAQIKRLAEMLKSLKPVEVEAKDIDNKDKLQMENKLPSEMNAELLSKLLLSNGVAPTDKDAVKGLADKLASRKLENIDRNKLEGVLKWCLDYTAHEATQKEAKQFSVVMVNDTHIGTAGFGVPTTMLIDGLVRYYAENEDTSLPMILILGGDNLEANHKSIKNEINKEISLSNIKNFEDELSSSGVSGDERKNLINEYKALLLGKRPIPNVDEQAVVFVDAIEPFAKFAKLVITVSGQHFNESYPNRDRDEATAIAPLLDKRLGDKVKVEPVSGGRTGAGSVQINDDFGIFVAHRVTEKVKEMPQEEKLVFGADIHKEVIEILGEKLVAIGAASSVRTNYPREHGMPSSENGRGFTRLNITMVKDERGEYIIEEVDTKLISLELLREKGYLKINPVIEAFEKNLYRAEMPLKTVVRGQKIDEAKVKVKN